MFELSHIEPGDVLQSINQKICISSKTSRPGIGIGIGGVITTAAEAMDYMHKCLKEGEGKEQSSLCVTVGNKDGDDILVQATIVKPKPTMSYQEMGIVVWFWQYLCIKSIEKSSLVYNSALKRQDQLISINDTVCRGLKPAQVGVRNPSTTLSVVDSSRHKLQRSSVRCHKKSRSLS
jgi:hypothetical protein